MTRNATRGLVVLFSGLIAFVFLGLWWVPLGGEGERISGVEAQASEAEAGTGSSEATELAPSAAATPASEVLPSAAPEPAREEALEHDAASFAVLRLVDAEGRSVSSGRAWVLADPTPTDLERFGDLSQVDAHFREHAEHVPCPDGRLRVPSGGSRTVLVIADSPGLWGRRLLSGDEAAAAPDLVLTRDVSLLVKVIGPTGTPSAGARVALAESETLRYRSLAGTSADDRGLAWLRHLQDSAPSLFEDTDSTWFVVAEALTLARVSQRIDPHAPPRDKVVLQLPATGSVELSVLDELGEPFRGEGEARLSLVPEGEPLRERRFGSRQRRRIGRDLSEGSARFEAVEAGARFAVEVSRVGSRVLTRAHGTTARVDGGSVSLVVRLGEDHPVLRFRALGSEGEVLARSQLLGELRVQAGFLDSNDDLLVDTDAEGIALVDLEADWSEGTARKLLLREESVGAQPLAFLDLSRKLDLGINDLGDVRLERVEPFAAGRVTGHDGQPVEVAQIQLGTRDLLEGVDGGLFSTWEDIGDVKVYTDAEGRFEVPGRFQGDSFRIAARADGHAGRWQPLEPGDQGVEIILESSGSLRGTVLYDEALPMGSLRVHLGREGETEGDEEACDRYRWETLTEPDFAIHDLLPGSFTLSVFAESSFEPVVRLDRLRVDSGEACADPRLDPIDLRGLLFPHLVLLEGLEPGEGARGTVRFGPAGAESLEAQTWVHGSEVTLVCQDESIDIDLTLRGYRAASLRNVGEEASVTLRKGLTAVLRLNADVELPKPPIFVKPCLVAAGDENGQIDWQAAHYDERREVEVSCPRSGDMEVHWIVERELANMSGATIYAPDAPQVVHVLDTDASQVFEVRLTEEDLRLMIERLN